MTDETAPRGASGSRPRRPARADHPVQDPTEPVPVGDPGTPPETSDAALRERLAALEAENASLKQRLNADSPPPGLEATGAPRRPQRNLGRSALAVLLLLAGALLAPVAVIASWTSGLVDDTDRWVATVGPLADDPRVQQAVTDRLTTAIVEAVGVDELAEQATSALAGLGLPPRVATLVESLGGPLANAASDLVRRGVETVVTSDAFSTAWVEANRTAHEQLVASLRGDPDAIASIGADGTLSVQLTTVVDAVRQLLVDRGFTILERLPEIDASFPLLQSDDLVRLQDAYRLLHALGMWLPWVSVLLLAAGVLAARRRARALVVAGLALAGAMLLLGVGIAVGRSVYVASLPEAIQRPDVAVVVYDQVVTFLRVALRAVAVLGLAVAAVAFVAGGSAAARGLRATWGHGVGAVRRLGDRHGVSTGPVGRWLFEQRVLVRVVVASVAGLVIVLADRVTPALVGWTALVAILVLLVVSLLARPAPPDVREAEPGSPRAA